jgi:GDP-L-fucose synthase
MINKDAKIYVAWHNGLVWSHIVTLLRARWYKNIVTRTRSELNLLDQKVVYAFYETERPQYVIDSAARVGGIKANMAYAADFLFENLEMQNNLIWWAHLYGVEKFLFLWSSCIYPRSSPQPMKEDYFMDGKLEPTNEGYAIAKIAWMKLCEKIYEQYGKIFISCMPTNIYGPGDHFDPDTSHVIPGMIRRMYGAKKNGDKEFPIWWTGMTRREFLYVDDLADAVVWMLENYTEKEFINVWTGEDISITELAQLIKGITGYDGELVFDTSKPDGFPRKLLDVSKLTERWWHHKTQLSLWLQNTYEHFLMIS